MEEKTRDMRILFVSANPTSTRKLDLNDELRTFQNCMKGHNVSIRLLPAAQPDDLKFTLESEDFDVVHFCGHAKEEGILMRNPNGVEELVSGEKIAEFLSKGKTRLAFLNACNTETVANDIRETVGMVIGTNKKVNDKVAKVMSEVFYSEIAKGYSLGDAYKKAGGEIDRRDKKKRGLNVYIDVTRDTDAKLPQGQRSRDHILLPGKRNPGQGVEIEGQSSWDKHFYVTKLDNQIRWLENDILLNQDILRVLLGLAVVAIPLLMWTASPVDLDSMFAMTQDNKKALVGDKSLLEWLSTLGAAMPVFIASIKQRFMLNGNEDLRLMKQLLNMVKSTDQTSPELQRRLHKIMENSLQRTNPA